MYSHLFSINSHQMETFYRFFLVFFSCVCAFHFRKSILNIFIIFGWWQSTKHIRFNHQRTYTIQIVLSVVNNSLFSTSFFFICIFFLAHRCFYHHKMFPCTKTKPTSTFLSCNYAIEYFFTFTIRDCLFDCGMGGNMVLIYGKFTF